MHQPDALGGMRERITRHRGLRRGGGLGRTVALAAAVSWAAFLVVGGLWLALVAAPAFPPAKVLLVCAGLTAIASGHVVFAIGIADRLFPRAPTVLGRTVATTAALAAVIGVAGLGLSLVGAYDAATPTVATNWVGADR